MNIEKSSLSLKANSIDLLRGIQSAAENDIGHSGRSGHIGPIGPIEDWTALRRFATV